MFEHFRDTVYPNHLMSLIMRRSEGGWTHRAGRDDYRAFSYDDLCCNIQKVRDGEPSTQNCPVTDQDYMHF